MSKLTDDEGQLEAPSLYSANFELDGRNSVDGGRYSAQSSAFEDYNSLEGDRR